MADSSSTPRKSRAALPLQDAIHCPLLLEGRHEEWIRCCTVRFLPVARRVAGSDPTAHDVLQESWISVLHGIRQYRGQSPACAWVRAIVRNEALRQATRLRGNVPLNAQGDSSEGPSRRTALPAAGASPEDEEHRRQLARILLEVVDRLPAAYRDIIRMRDLDEQSPSAVAARLHITRSSVSTRLHRAHRLLRQRLLRRLGIGGVVAPHCEKEYPPTTARSTDRNSS